jgi:hypothetical protein
MQVLRQHVADLLSRLAGILLADVARHRGQPSLDRRHCCIERCPAILTARLPVGRRADDAVERAGAPDHPEAAFGRRQARPRIGRSLVKITG